MIWVTRLAVVVAGYFVGLAFFAILSLICAVVAGFALGITNPVFRQVEYGVCLVTAYLAAFFVMRPAWPLALPQASGSTARPTTSEPGSNT